MTFFRRTPHASLSEDTAARREASVRRGLDAIAKMPPEARLTWARGALEKWARDEPNAARQFAYGLIDQADEELDRRAAQAADATRSNDYGDE